MDNLPAHKVAGIRAFAFEAVGATVVYLSKEERLVGKLPPATLRPYSPDFSLPIKLLVLGQRVSPRTLGHVPMLS